MSATWSRTDIGVLELPSGRRIRGRGIRGPLPVGPLPDFAVHLLGKPPPAVSWESRWVRWPDFRLPSERQDAGSALIEAWVRTHTQRVEIACGGGHGRTGTALACIAILDGVPAHEAVAFVRAHYSARAVETPGQRRFVATFRGETSPHRDDMML
ncbi:hypothetical protein BH24ACT9_BH24ACT9_08320 [soil metagenome]